MPKDDFKFHFPLRVRWAECDPQGVANSAAYLNWVEVAQAEYCRNLGLGLYRLAKMNAFDTILARITVEFKSPALVDDLLEVYIRVAHMGTSSIAMEFEVYRQDEDKPLALVKSVHASYDNQRQRSRPVPHEVRRLFSHYEETGERLPLDQFPSLAQASAPPESP